MEAAFLEWLRSRLPPCPELPLGLGDDAAWIRAAPDGQSTGDLVVTCDLLCDGVHFRLADASLSAIGRKALAVNLSDMAAMAVRPREAVVALLWPRALDPLGARTLYEGLLQLADHYQVRVVGGDTNCWSGDLVISVTVMGRTGPRGPLTRRGACPGDAILVTGQLGGSLLGHHLTFEPRIDEALWLQEHYTLRAGMDISDGLSLDLHRLVRESQVGAELDLSAIPVAPSAQERSQSSGRTPLQHALADGEDFELLLVVPPDEAARLVAEQPLAIRVTQIGSIVAEPGLWQRSAQGTRQSLPVEGYWH